MKRESARRGVRVVVKPYKTLRYAGSPGRIAAVFVNGLVSVQVRAADGYHWVTLSPRDLDFADPVLAIAALDRR